MKRKIEPLIVNRKYNMKEIMRRAWAYYNNPFCTQYRNNFKGALKAAWVDAKLAMDEELSDYQPVFAKRSMSELYYSTSMRQGFATR